MNHVTPDLCNEPDKDDAARALQVLRDWAAKADPLEVAQLDPSIARLLPGGEVSNYPALNRTYPGGFRAG